MSDIMATMGLDISSFKNTLNQLNESTQKVSSGLKGNMLALGAGVVGVASILATSLIDSQNNFTKLTKEAEGFSESLANITASGGVESIASGLANSKTQMDHLSQATEDAAGFMESVGAGVASLFGGTGAIDRIEKISQLSIKLADERFRSEMEIVRLLKIETGVIELRNKGDNYSADVAEERLRLEKELSGLQQKAAAGTIAGATADKAASVAKAKSELKLKGMLADKEKKDSDERKKQADERQKEVDKLAETERKRGEEVAKASERMAAAEQSIADAETRKKSLKDQAAIQSGKVADAEFRLSKSAKGTAEWYERAAELARERLSLEDLLSERAKAYNEGTSAGRKFDREQKKQEKENKRGRKRLDEQIQRENKRNGGGDAKPVPDGGGGGGVAPKPIDQPMPNMPAIGAKSAMTTMQVERLIVQTLSPK
jgi:hypothetical protein